MSDGGLSASGFLVRELRNARAVAGLSQEELGKAINYSSSLVSAVEKGQRPPTRDYLALVDKALATGGIFERLLVDIVSLDRAPVWFRDWVVIEREATLLRWFEPLVLPGLLQTEAYARAILEWGNLHDPGDVEKFTASRMERREILNRPTPTHLIALIDENVLHRLVGDATVMAEQCAHLLACAQRPNVQLHVVPPSAGAHAGLAGSFILAKSQDLEVAHIDSTLHSYVVDRRIAVDRLTRKWEAIRGEALPRAQSIAVIREVATTWQT
jgi:transcriptional regulator with XRE-family HTH domain